MRVIAGATLSLFLAVSVDAQYRPDFSGTWVLDPARSESSLVADGQRIVPVSITMQIVQGESHVEIDTVRNGVRESRRYAVQPMEPPRPVGTSGSAGTVMNWERDSLVTITPHQINGMAVTTTERRTLSADGRHMTVVTTLEVQHGYQGDGRNASPPARDVYVRQAR